MSTRANGDRPTVTGRPDLVVRGGTVVNPGGACRGDLLVGGGRVIGLVEPDTVPAAEGNVRQVDTTGCLILPGGVDPHCHVGFTSGEFTSLDDYGEATKAALFGGTTTIVDFAIPRPGRRPADAVEAQRTKATQGFCDSALHACVVDWDPTVPGQLDAMVADGVVTVKMFTTYRGETMANADTILRVMSHLCAQGGMVFIHCEANPIIEEYQRRSARAGSITARDHHHTRPELAENASVAEVLAIAEAVSAPVYFVHQSTPEAVDQVAAARRRGVNAFSETVTHHLVLDESRYGGKAPERFVCCPPLRSGHTVQRLRRRVHANLVTTIGSDHCCYDISQKERNSDDVRHMPNGLPGVETRLPVAYSTLVAAERLPVERFVELTSTNPARLNGLYPRKGALLPGSDADFCVWDPAHSWTIATRDLHMATDYTPYEGMAVTGAPRTVALRGDILIEDGRWVATKPAGTHVPGVPSDRFLF